MTAPSRDGSPAWRALQALHDRHGRDFDLRDAFAADPARADRLTIEAPHVVADLSKNLWDDAVVDALLALAAERDVAGRRDAMLRGDAINATEGRPVRHVALRVPAGSPIDDACAAQARAELHAMLAFAERVRGDGRVRDVVSIGIGGSDLGPRMAVAALRPFASRSVRTRFVANIDAHEIDETLEGLDPASTLFVVASKSFGTRETLLNAALATRWLRDGGVADPSAQLVGITARPEAARARGMGTIFRFGDGIGGRYSMWSPIGLSIAIAIGAKGFRSMLEGAHAMDRHFAETPPERNLPLLLGLLDLWYRDFHGFATRAVVPYHHGLCRLPAYLQQLEMESNGKSVDLDGEPLPVASAPVLWGEPGTNAQHSFFQMLHQGSDRVPVEFVVVARAAHAHVESHRALVANALAQSRALMTGRSLDEVLDGVAPTPHAIAKARHRVLPGNRPSTTLLLERLDPASLGALVALQEHRVFTSAAAWGINAFDQWGVEVGKTVAADLEARLADPSRGTDGLDASTAAMLRRLGAGTGTGSGSGSGAGSGASRDAHGGTGTGDTAP